MNRYLLSICQLAFLSLCCVLITVRESGSAFVPGRCLCPQTQESVRGRLKELTVYPKSPSCDRATVIVTLKMNNDPVCLNPEARMGKLLANCWKRAHKLGHDVKLCLRRRRRRGGRGGQHHKRLRQRNRGQSRTTSLSDK